MHVNDAADQAQGTTSSTLAAALLPDQGPIMTTARRKPKPRKPASVSDAILKALVDDFTRNGPSAIERVRDKTPDKYLALMATLLPKVAHVPEAAAAISASPAFGPISHTARWLTEKLAENAVDPPAESSAL